MMSTHKAVATVAIRAPLEIIEVPTIRPIEREVRVKVEWTASTPLDLHQNDGGLLVKHPQILGDGVAGTVVEVGDMVRNLTVGDQVSKENLLQPGRIRLNLERSLASASRKPNAKPSRNM
jgi:D-arabinose 1-dehydrogenase-like Zn-dependent alcohol dehydrogenase